MTDLLDDILPAAGPLDLDALEGSIPANASFAYLPADQLRALIAELRIRRSTDHFKVNGQVAHGYETTCHGCGAKITVKRRPVPGKHNWCETCTANGEPAAQRARDYRDRKREERSA